MVKPLAPAATTDPASDSEAPAIRIRAGYRITIDFREATPALLMLYPHPSLAGSLELPGSLQVDPPTTVTEYLDLYGNRCGRVLAPPGPVTLSDKIVVVTSGLPDPQAPEAAQHPVQDLPDEAVLYLLSSRYRKVDSEIKDLAGSLFNNLQPGWPRVAAICAYVHGHLQFELPAILGTSVSRQRRRWTSARGSRSTWAAPGTSSTLATTPRESAEC